MAVDDGAAEGCIGHAVAVGTHRQVLASHLPLELARTRFTEQCDVVASEAACIFVRLLAETFVAVVRGDATEDLVDQRLLLAVEEIPDGGFGDSPIRGDRVA